MHLTEDTYVATPEGVAKLIDENTIGEPLALSAAVADIKEHTSLPSQHNHWACSSQSLQHQQHEQQT